MRMSGTPATVKKPEHRPSKGHPHVYHGIFLRFTSTAKNIVYYDVDTGTIKVATHKLHNKSQYTSNRTNRSYASRYIVDLIADDKNEKRYEEPMLDHTIKHLIPTDIPPLDSSRGVSYCLWSGTRHAHPTRSSRIHQFRQPLHLYQRREIPTTIHQCQCNH